MLYNKRIFESVFSWKGKYWYKNIFEIPNYFRSIHRLVKYGYDETAWWNAYAWFIDTMRDILTHYIEHGHGYPLDTTEEEWAAILNKMVSLLDDMEEWNPKYEAEEYMVEHNGYKIQDYEKVLADIEKAKDEFFKLFAKHFYNLWD